MSKREKIIVGFMVFAILYGGYNFLFSNSGGGKKKLPGQRPVAVNEFVTDLIKLIQGADTTATDTLILKKSSAAWQKDPFMVVKNSEGAGEALEQEPVTLARGETTGPFHYSGYMEMGKSRLAIINGMEYQAGDNLEIQGAALKKISPREVHIYVAAERRVIVVPIDDTAK